MTNASLSFSRDTANAGNSAMPPLATWLLGALFLGVVAMLSLPAARADSAAFGWMPLWLLGMPLASLAALAAARFHLRRPRRRMPDSSPDRTSDAEGKSVSVRVDLGGGRTL